MGSIPRQEAPVLNARIRKRYLAAGRGGFPIAMIGAPNADPTYAADVLGNGPDTLAALAAGKLPFADVLAKAKKPMIIVGHGALTRPDGAAITRACWELAEQVGAITPDWHGFNILHVAASRVAALDLGFLPGPKGRDVAGMLKGGVDVLWLLGADEFPTDQIGPKTFVIYQAIMRCGRGAGGCDPAGRALCRKAGHIHQYRGAAAAGVPRRHAPGDAREDWRILRAFSEVAGHKLPYDTMEALRARMVQANPVFGQAEWSAWHVGYHFPPGGQGSGIERAVPAGHCRLLPDPCRVPCKPDHGNLFGGLRAPRH